MELIKIILTINAQTVKSVLLVKEVQHFVSHVLQFISYNGLFQLQFKEMYVNKPVTLVLTQMLLTINVIHAMLFAHNVLDQQHLNVLRVNLGLDITINQVQDVHLIVTQEPIRIQRHQCVNYAHNAQLV